MNSKWKEKYIPLIIALAIPLIVGGISGFLIRNSVEIYKKLPKPPLAPPSWLFPVVWAILYVLMGISSYRIYRAKNPDTTEALRVYAYQLLINFFWAPVFFNLQSYFLALIILGILWYLIYQMILAFRPIDRLAANLQIPYLVWVTFAAYLNLGILWLS